MSDDTWTVRYRLSTSERTQLVNKHLRSLSDFDRLKVNSAFITTLKSLAIGASIGLGVGLFCARTSRKRSLKLLNAFKSGEQPLAVVFPNGKTGKYSLRSMSTHNL